MRGFKDNIPPASYAIEHVRNMFEKVSKLYGCDFVDMPLVEEAQLYFRTSGSASDVCNKELFEVRKYKGEFEDWVLRPEGTASCMRAINEANFMQDHKFARLAYFAPMFRYNRPQKGRYRQFLQAGWEFMGVPGAEIDYEMILGACEFLNMLGLKYTLQINSIGNAQDRQEYRALLSKVMKLDEGQDPLKMLDKAEQINHGIDNGNDNDIPKISVNADDKQEFDKLCNMLAKNNIAIEHNPYLVRGLDYYNATVFEIKVGDQTVLAGGRYDGLMQQIGGKYLPATGFGAGVEGIVENMHFAYTNKNIGIISIDENDYAMQVASKIRAHVNMLCEESKMELDYSGCIIFWNMQLKKALQEADKQGFRYIIIVGETEKKSNIFRFKDLVERKEYCCRFSG